MRFAHGQAASDLVPSAPIRPLFGGGIQLAAL